MNWYKIFYLFSLADKISGTMLTFAIVSISAFVVMLIWLIVGNIEDSSFEVNTWKIWRKWFWRSILSSLIFWTIWALVPNRTDMLLIIAGGSVGEFITHDSSSRAIPKDITLFLHRELQNQIGDIGEDTKRQLGLQTPKEKVLDKFKDLTKEQIIQYLSTDSTINVKQ